MDDPKCMLCGRCSSLLEALLDQSFGGLYQLTRSMAPMKSMKSMKAMKAGPSCLCTLYHFVVITSSTAQGGGGSFKNRKPIGEIACCESRMAAQTH